MEAHTGPTKVLKERLEVVFFFFFFFHIKDELSQDAVRVLYYTTTVIHRYPKP